MIKGMIHEADKWQPYLSERLNKGLAFLAVNDLASLSKGKHEIDGELIFATVDEYETKPRGTKQGETHDLYIDIQCLAYGREIIGVSARTPDLPIADDRRPTQDLTFYGKVADETAVSLTAGEFIVLFPWEVHTPGCQASEQAETVKKIVVKVKA